MYYVFLADGFEEIEALAPVDLMRRASLPVVTVGVTGENVTSTHNITVVADILLDEVSFSDMQGIVLPGGMPGTINLKSSEIVDRAIDYCNSNNMMIAAICAAPSILGEKNILNGKEATAFPEHQTKLNGAKLSKSFVCTDGNIITARGAGVSLQFGLEIIKYLIDKQTSDNIKGIIQWEI